MPTLSIVILTTKTKNFVKECLKGIKLVEPKIFYEIIVVDNASADGTSEMIREQFKEARFIESPRNVGYAAGNNLGISAACGKYILILNPDIAILSGSLEKLVEYMDAHPDVGLAGPKLVNPDRSLQYSCYLFPNLVTPVYRRTPLGRLGFAASSVSKYLMKDWQHDTARNVDWLLGAALIVRRAAIEKVGLLDERFFLYFEDTDWCRRFWEAGYFVTYVPESIMVHYHRRVSADGLWFMSLLKPGTRIHIKSGLKYFWKYRHRNSLKARL